MGVGRLVKIMLAASAAFAAAQPATAAWRKASTDHFVIYSEQKPRELDEFNSAAGFEKDGGVDIGKVPVHRVPQLLRDRPLPVEKLVAVSRARIGSDEGRALYARGWLLVHYLYMDESRRGQLNDYLKRMAAGEGSVAAARAAFGDLKKLDHDLERYLNTRLFYYKVSAQQLPTPKVTV